jgi:restriction system protein
MRADYRVILDACVLANHSVCDLLLRLSERPRLTSEGADAGIVVTSGHFTREAWEFASGKPIELIDGKALIKLIKDVQVSAKTAVAEPATSVNVPPECPDCGSKLVLRTARKGSNAGSSFWGCPSYPKCRGTRPQ